VTLASPADLIATRGHGAVAAFNVIMLEQLEAFAAAAERTDTGVILQLSQNAVRYHGSLAPIGTAVLERARASRIPFAVQLDHADDVGLIREAAQLGFTSIMFDGSRQSYADNVETTRALTVELHERNVWVEAELGEIGGKDGVHSATARTDPAEAADFVAATGVDGLAVAVGSSHAMTDRTARLDIALIRSLAEAVPVPLVLHGSSGVADGIVQEAIDAGIAKVNFGTRFNAALTAAVRAHLDDEPLVIDPRKYLAAGRQAVIEDALHLLELLAVAPRPAP
jgi:fructose-bisphosphate aldolase class II